MIMLETYENIRFFLPLNILRKIVDLAFSIPLEEFLEEYTWDQSDMIYKYALFNNYLKKSDIVLESKTKTLADIEAKLNTLGLFTEHFIFPMKIYRKDGDVVLEAYSKSELLSFIEKEGVNDGSKSWRVG